MEDLRVASRKRGVIAANLIANLSSSLFRESECSDRKVLAGD